MKKSGKFITALLLSSALICAAIPSQSLQAQTVTITKEAISDDLYCVTELVETSGSGIQPFSATQAKSGSKTVVVLLVLMVPTNSADVCALAAFLR